MKLLSLSLRTLRFSYITHFIRREVCYLFCWKEVCLVLKILFHVQNNEVGRKANSEDHLSLYKLIILPMRFPAHGISKFIALKKIIVLQAYNKNSEGAIRSSQLSWSGKVYRKVISMRFRFVPYNIGHSNDLFNINS